MQAGQTRPDDHHIVFGSHRIRRSARRGVLDRGDNLVGHRGGDPLTQPADPPVDRGYVVVMMGSATPVARRGRPRPG